jgi:predicted alpha/beta-hydrolase family hydrolase
MRTGVIVAGGLGAPNACEVLVTCRKRLGNRGSKATRVEFEKMLLAFARKETAEIPHTQYSSVKLAL